jgi:ribosomal-protein-alanine N-acetyltransferase
MRIETKRLYLKNWEQSDVDAYLTLSKDVGYNCFSLPGRFLVRNAEEAAEKIRNRMSLFEKTRLGKFPIFLKETGEFVGTCGLEPYELASQPEVNLGYRLCLKHWGRGYATESATAMLRYGFGALNLPRIIAFVLPQNTASINILEKLGGMHVQDFEHAGLPHRLYDFGRARYAE